MMLLLRLVDRNPIKLDVKIIKAFNITKKKKNVDTKHQVGMTNIVTSNTANLPVLLLLTERLRPLWTDSVGPDILSPHASLSRALLLLLKLLHKL